MAVRVRRAWVCAVALLVSVLTSATHTRAEDLRPIPEVRIESARGMALGTGARAAAASTQAQAENPANLVLGGLYHIEGFLSYQPTFRRTGVGASVVDSMTSSLAAGASARMILGDNSAGENSGWEARVGLAAPVSDMFSLGISGRYLKYTLSDPHATPEHKPKLDKPLDQTFKISEFTLDASMVLRPIAGLQFAALAYNLIDTKSTLAPLMVGGAASVGLNAGFSFGGDVLVDLNTHKAFDGPSLLVGGGMEYLANGTVPLRAGYLFDQGREQHGVTGGLGFVDQRVGIQLSLRQIIVGGKETTMMGALQYFVQ